MSRSVEDLAAVKARSWFYEFELPDGTKTACDAGASVAHLHATRLQMLEAFLDTLGDTSKMTALDVACHQGWFTQALARRFQTVTGVDVNHDSLAAAVVMARARSLQNVGFQEHAVEDLDYFADQPFDVALCLGLIYHAENPVLALRRVAACATRAIIVETQTAPGAHYDAADQSIVEIPWGVAPNTRNVEGWFALVKDDDNREGGQTGLALVPTAAAVHAVLRACGFARTVKLSVPFNGHDALTNGDRVMIAGAR